MQLVSFTIRHYERLASTQDFLLEALAGEALPEGTTIVADDQFRGKGQEGTNWESTAGMNLTFSLLLYPGFLHAGQQFLINKVISLACHDSLSSIPGISAPLRIKWPNDLYIGHRKTGGILINHAIMGNKLLHTVIGTGINVNQTSFSSACPNPTSVRLESGAAWDTASLLRQILDRTAFYYHKLRKHPSGLDEAYTERLYLKDIMKPYLVRGQPLEAMICGVNEYGMLLLQTRDGLNLECGLKEVVFPVT
ncbi:MAG TPA: biotin--[acetyl-CoA-carboxylase] ligase [Bacteroidales bacterium]|nr:biotin--[acetyl-CoA-carboxylase] ligase [Bacteroidales bacterium]HSA42924.1 biotin--[acetyl-CoA-carboxylase] ligase [Bacteroidales bacterium]